MARISGSCLCGAVRYESSVDPVLMGVCHCKHCQRQSGSAFSMLIAVPKGTLQVSGEPLVTYEDKGDTGQTVLRRFCPKCGSPVLSDAATPEIAFFRSKRLSFIFSS